jgi:ATP-dependent Zn protease
VAALDDDGRALHTARRLTRSEAEAVALVEEARGLAERLIVEHRSAVEWLARNLLERRELDAAEVAALIEET